MIECTKCRTLNPDSERVCLSCGTDLPASAQAVGAARCPEGHPIDPSWKSCPYCDRLRASGEASEPPRSTRLEGDQAAGPPSGGGAARTRLEENKPSQRASKRTRLEGESGEPGEVAPAQAEPGPKPTRLEEPDAPARGHRTVLHEPEAPQPDAAPPAAPQAARAAAAAVVAPGSSTRRLVAVLAAPDLGPGGTVFAVRAGKNVLGADRSCDVVLASDPQVSGEHAIILHRDGAFHLADRLSSNGTWLNGSEVPANGTMTLRDRDRVRLGVTELVFLVIDSETSTPPETRETGG